MPEKKKQSEPPVDRSAALKRKLDRLWRQYLAGELTVDEWADKSNAVDPPVLIDKVKR